MAALTAEGVILRKFPLRETSYILVVYTKEFGKVQGVIKGVRSPYPQFAGNFEIFTRCDLLFYKKKKTSLDLITQCETIESFLHARKDIERLTYANYFIELVNVVTDFHDANEKMYELLVESLRMLTPGSSSKRIARVFEIKLLETLGLTPYLDKCIECNGDIKGKGFFGVDKGGALCSSCGKPGSYSFGMSLGTLNFMKKILDTDLARTSRIKVSKEVGAETEMILKSFLQYQIGKPIKTLNFLNKLEQIKS